MSDTDTTTIAPDSEQRDDTTTPRPRIRFAAIVWGLIYAVTAVTVLAVIADPDRRDAVADFLWSLDGPTALLIGLVSIGFLVLVGGVLTAVRRAQGRRSATSPQ